ncbi:TPA: hypothetical protein UN285_000611 [Stenotrophomonas maltophilia]|nr:hypothetical protein [Stenotrophomonas maltophilia]HEL3014822.1 hypothetical protein [Stenotrophomonas maltophilia]HEL4809488.1 hypothetical protein [Stenotrophomonas maltophilia]HEL5391650.1 hypothetical protein [Stenotrophomonas maltophilia]
MDAIEKRARELLDAELRKLGLHEDAYHVGCGAGLDRNDQAAINAIAAALTPPDGYVPERSVLVAATRLRKLASAATPMAHSAYIKAAELIEMAVVAARPDTPDSATVTVASKREAEELSRRRVARIEGAE